MPRKNAPPEDEISSISTEETLDLMHYALQLDPWLIEQGEEGVTTLDEIVEYLNVTYSTASRILHVCRNEIDSAPYALIARVDPYKGWGYVMTTDVDEIDKYADWNVRYIVTRLRTTANVLKRSLASTKGNTARGKRKRAALRLLVFVAEQLADLPIVEPAHQKV